MTNTISATISGLGKDAPKLVKTVNHVKKKKRNGDVEVKVENTYTIDIVPGCGPVYGDTDSNYFTMAGIVNNKEDAIAAADAIANVVNDSFQGFMQQAFNCTPGFDDLIKAAREIVARTGILQAKKKYMMAMVDKDGDPVEEGSEDELKTMGSDIKLSSTPEIIRKMLSDVVMAVLNEKPKAEIDEIIIKFREYLGRDKDDSTDDLIDPLDLSAIMSVNELEEYQAKWELIERQGRGKVSIPANVRAAINYNYLIKHLKRTDEPEIMSGGKVKLLWLMPNDFGFDNIAFPSDTDELPTWFHEVLEADMGLMELKLVDQKLQNIFDALDWSVPTFQSQLVGTLLDIDDATVDRKKAKARKPKIDVEKQQVVAGNLLDFD